MKSFFPLFSPKDNVHFFVSLNLDVLEVIVLWPTWSQVELGHLWKWARLKILELNSATRTIIMCARTITSRSECGITTIIRENHRICKHNHIFGDFVLMLVKKHFWSMGCPTFSHLAPKIISLIPFRSVTSLKLVSLVGSIKRSIMTWSPSSLLNPRIISRGCIYLQRHQKFRESFLWGSYWRTWPVSRTARGDSGRKASSPRSCSIHAYFGLMS